MVCDFIPTKYSTGQAITDVVEGLTFKQTEMQIAVWSFTGIVKQFWCLF